MPDIVLTDATSPTPVDRTFQVAKTTGDYSMFEDRSLGIYVGYGKIHFETRRPSGPVRVDQARNIKSLITLETPLIETEATVIVNGSWTTAPTVSHRPKLKLEMVLPERTTWQEKADLVTMFRDLIAEAVVTDFLYDHVQPT